MKKEDLFVTSQIIMFNPILKEAVNIRMQYFYYLKKLLRIVGWHKTKYTQAQFKFYEDVLCKESSNRFYSKTPDFECSYCFLIPYDIAAMIGYHTKLDNNKKITMLVEQIVNDFSFNAAEKSFLENQFNSLLDNNYSFNNISSQSVNVKKFSKYIELAHKNICFMKQRPFTVLVTATMSAGKSTLINSIVGCNISLTQNMACTSKIHTITSKPFSDGVISEYDHELNINANKNELLSDNKENISSKITVGAYFDGKLSGKRIVLYDSPGVNSSENGSHSIITEQILKSRKYDLILYVLNSTQLGTTDEEHHLATIKQYAKHTKIIFVMNKADQLISEDDNIYTVIENQREFLVSQGFKNPIICPVSSRAAFLAKKSDKEEIGRLEKREIDNYIDKFEIYNLSYYYKQTFNRKSLEAKYDGENLLNKCGFNYFEEILLNTLEEKANDSNICEV